VEELRQALREVELDVRTGNTLGRKHLEEKEVEQIVKFFFHDVFGAGACQRVAELVKYPEGEILGTDHGSVSTLWWAGFTSLEEAKAWIQAQRPHKQYGHQSQLLEWIMEHRDMVEG
jgi:hypothetical protein